jgi:rubrerythrin
VVNILDLKSATMNFLLWMEYFKSNQGHFDHLDWEDDNPLTLYERKKIISSIGQFQRGEYSEGKHFLEFAKSMKDESYIQTLRFFIKEEQNHAIVLGKFMDKHKMAKLKDDWLDNVFRMLRKLAGLECTITVLLTAEIISMIYYQALAKVTASNLLKQICNQILIDEEMHLQFQSHSLRILYERKNIFSIFISRTLHKILMAGTILMVWIFHCKVLKAGKYTFYNFFRSVFDEFKRCETLIKDKSLSLPAQMRIIRVA